MKKRIIVLLVLSFLLSGCSVTYNLEIDGDNYIETTSFLGDYYADNYRQFEVYSTKPIPLSKLDSVQSESDDKITGINYYQVEDISDDDNFGLKYSGKFGGKHASIENSSILSFGVGEFEFINEDNIATINIPSNIKLFDQYGNLDEIVINIKSKYKVLENNADEVNNNIYTWYITRNNYTDKIISIKYKTNNKIDLSFFDNPMVRFATVIVILIFVSIIIYLFVNNKYKKKNVL